MTEGPAWTMAGRFLLLSLVAVGGANSVLPDIHRLVVEVNGWMTGDEFAELFAIAQAAPGPNVMVVTLIGWHVAGLAGALAATAAICGPSCLLTFGVSRVWDRFRDRPWRAAVQAGLAPVTVGLVLAASYLVTRGADRTPAAYALTAASAALLLFTRVNPLWLLAGGAALGLAGLI
jgi:chromate transporter